MARASWRRCPSRTLKTLPMKRSARRVDHGSSRLRSYGGACPSGRRYKLLWMRTSAPSPLFRFGLQGCQKAKKINVLVARTLFYSTPVTTLLKTARRYLSHISCCRHIGEFRVEGEVSMKGRNQHVTKRSDGNWRVKGEGASRASFVTTTQSEVIKLGRRICSNQESEFIIHRRDDRIRARDSRVHDPFPPRG